ncbi:MAG: hypothetical protein PHO29_07390 [Acetobacterium sp.]|nr:hypothetical protein [Acetobacterium sp.]
MKKKLLEVLLVLVLGVILVGCSAPAADSDAKENVATTQEKTKTEEKVADFNITLEGVDGKTQFNQADLASLPLVEQTIKMTKKDGSETGGVFKGYLLKDVVAELGITDYTSIMMAASDGYNKTYDKATIEAEDSLLTVSLDGVDLVSVLAGSMGSSAWIQDISKMSVVK